MATSPACVAGASKDAPAKPLLVLFGSQTGSAEGLAKKVVKEASAHGMAARLMDMAKHDAVDWSKEENLLVVTSTYGDGEPPDNARPFWDYLQSEAASALAHLRYSVLALGDTNYSAFCQFGKNCDERLAQIGAQPIHPRVDCDVDYDEAAKTWMAGAFASIKGAESSAAESAAIAVDEEPAGYTKANPFPAKLLTNLKLTADGSGKEVRHFEISLEGSGLEYSVGDALGVYPTNCPSLVSEVLAALGWDGEEAVAVPNGGETALRDALQRIYDLRNLSPDLLKYVAGRGNAELAALLEPDRKDDLKKHLYGREVIDFVRDLNGHDLSPNQFLGLLKKLQPRLYSISSSPKAHPGEVHLTVGAVRYDAHGRGRKGVCSTYLADRVGEGPVRVYVQQSHGFKLPEDLSRDVIMVGPGTGIAPFRAFLEEREATQANGRNWLFFGDQKRASDFLYQERLESWLASGHLARLDLAFSRDQAEKIYVQHRMLEAATELWAWLEGGAHFYVCGDASRMAKDVDAALQKVAEIAGGLTPEQAAAYVDNLKTSKRYQRDVY